VSSLANSDLAVVLSLESSGDDLENTGDQRTDDDAHERPHFRTHGKGA
jgi:hypothetical protein